MLYLLYHESGLGNYMIANQFSDVFVSYRRKDVEIAKRIVERLQQEGKEVWVDWDDIPPGSEVFTDDINRGLQGADTFICILSPDYLESTYCVELELERAVSLHKRIIPIVYRKFEGMPIPPGIGSINWIYFTPHAGQTNTFDEAIPRVMEALNADLDHIRAHKRFLLRAIDWTAQKKRDSFLLRGDEIDQAEQWLTAALGKDPLPTELHKEYISTSRQEERQRQRMLLAGVSIALVVSLILGILSLVLLNSTRIAEEQAVANLNIAEQNEARAIVAESTAVSAEATAVKRAKDADIRLLANSLDDIARRDPFLAYRLGIGLLEVEDLPLRAKGLIIDLFLSTGAVKTYNYPVNSIKPSGDNSSIYIASDADIIRIDAQTGEVDNIFSGHLDWISAFDVNPNNTRMVSVDIMGQMVIWDIASAEAQSVIDLPDSVGYVKEISIVTVYDLEAAIFTDDVGGLHTVSLVDAQYESEIVAEDSENTRFYFSPTNTFLLGFSNTESLVWNIESEEELLLDQKFTNSNVDYEFNEDETLLVVGTTDLGEVLVINLENLEIQATIEGLANFEVFFGQNIIVGVNFSNNVVFYDFDGELLNEIVDIEAYQVLAAPDNDTLLTLTYDGQLIFNGLFRDFNHKLAYSPHVAYVEFLTDTTFFTSSDNQQIIWDYSYQEALSTLPFVYGNVKMLPDGTSAIKVNELNELVMVDVTTDEPLKTIGTLPDELKRIEMSVDGKYLVTQTENVDDFTETIIIWDIEQGEMIQRLSDHYTESLYAIDFSANGDYMITVAWSNEVVLWHLPDFEIVEVFSSIEREILSIRLSPMGDVAYAGILGNSIVAIDLQNEGALIGEYIGHRDYVYGLDVSADGKTLVSGSNDNTIIVWDVEKQTPIQRFDEHLDDVTHVRFSPDGTSVLSGSNDDRIIQWDLQSGESIRILNEHSDNILSLGVSNDGKAALSASYDYTAKYWQLNISNAELIQWANEHLELQQLTCEERVFYNLPNQCE